MRKIQMKTDQRRFVMVYYDFLENKVLSPNEKIIFVYLKLCAGQKVSCYPSIKTIAVKSGLSESTVKRTLASMKEKGIVQSIQRFDAEGQHSNLYVLHDTADIWASQTLEEMLEKKEKASCAPTQEAKADENQIHEDCNSAESQSQERERYSLEDVKAYYSYDAIKGKANVDLARLAIETLYSFLNVNHAVTMQGQSISQMMLTKKLLDLTPKQIEQALDIYAKSKEPQNPKAYLLAILLSVVDGKAKPKSTKAKANKFNNFDQRQYNYDDLETVLTT